MSTRAAPRPARATRSRTWVAIGAALTAMTVAFIALVAIQISGSASGSAPLVVVADPRGVHPDVDVHLTRDMFEQSTSAGTAGTYSVTVRVRNDDSTPRSVTAAVSGGSSTAAATLTAALTVDGAKVRSGSLSGLQLGPFTLDAHSTTPVVLEVDVNASQLDALFTTGPLTLHLSAA